MKPVNIEQELARCQALREAGEFELRRTFRGKDLEVIVDAVERELRSLVREGHAACALASVEDYLHLTILLGIGMRVMDAVLLDSATQEQGQKPEKN